MVDLADNGSDAENDARKTWASRMKPVEIKPLTTLSALWSHAQLVKQFRGDNVRLEKGDDVFYSGGKIEIGHDALVAGERPSSACFITAPMNMWGVSMCEFIKTNELNADILERNEAKMTIKISDFDSVRKLAVAGFHFDGADLLRDQETRLRDAQRGQGR